MNRLRIQPSRRAVKRRMNKDSSSPRDDSLDMTKVHPTSERASDCPPAVSDDSQDLNCTAPHPVDLGQVRQVHREILSQEKSQRMAEFFSLLGDPNRLRILSALAVNELCVCDLATAVKMSESAVSHQLRTLRSMRLVGYRRQGRNVFYYLKDSHVLNLYREVAEHLDEPDDS